MSPLLSLLTGLLKAYFATNCSSQNLRDDLEEGSLMLEMSAEGVRSFYKQGLLETGPAGSRDTSFWRDNPCMVSCAQTKKLLKNKHSEQGSKETPRMGAEGEGQGLICLLPWLYIFILILNDTSYFLFVFLE